jgi:hypothetical protein
MQPGHDATEFALQYMYIYLATLKEQLESIGPSIAMQHDTGQISHS